MSAARCDRTDLLVDQCAHCRGLDTEPVQDDWSLRGPAFRARYGGRCQRCDDPVEVGDRIGYLASADGIVHAECGVES